LENEGYIKRTGFKNKYIWKIKDHGRVQTHS